MIKTMVRLSAAIVTRDIEYAEEIRAHLEKEGLDIVIITHSFESAPQIINNCRVEFVFLDHELSHPYDGRFFVDELTSYQKVVGISQTCSQSYCRAFFRDFLYFQYPEFVAQELKAVFVSAIMTLGH